MELRHFIKRYFILIAFKHTIAIGCSYLVGVEFGGLIHSPLLFTAGLWCAISTALVLQVEMKESFKAGWLRLLGSAAGSLTSLVMATLMGYTLWSFLISIFITIILISIFHLEDMIRIASLTVAVIMIIGMSHPTISPLMNSLSRLAESIIGIMIGLFFVWVFLPVHKKLKV